MARNRAYLGGSSRAGRAAQRHLGPFHSEIPLAMAAAMRSFLQWTRARRTHSEARHEKPELQLRFNVVPTTWKVDKTRSEQPGGARNQC